MSTETLNKPQAAIDAGLYTKEEAAIYLGLPDSTFQKIAKQLTGVKLGGSTFYSKFQLQAYLAKLIDKRTNVQQIGNNPIQPIEN